MRIYWPGEDETLKSIFDHMVYATRQSTEPIYCRLGSSVFQAKALPGRSRSGKVFGIITPAFRIDNTKEFDKKKWKDFCHIMELLKQRWVLFGEGEPRSDHPEYKVIRRELGSTLTRIGEFDYNHRHTLSIFKKARVRRILT